jgi:NAD-dependent deacetylase
MVGLSRQLIDAVGVLLTQARSALFITGSGLSADSGLPSYRGIAGITRRRADDGPAIEAALSPAGLARDPATTWQRFLDMDAAIAAATPNRGHEVLAALGRRLRCVTMTQNVDGLERAAGHRVLELHGSLRDLRCPRCDLRFIVSRLADLPAPLPPACARCGAAMRPDLALFGEALPLAPFDALEEELARGFDLVFAIGVGAMTPYLARPLLVAKSEGTPTIEIGVSSTDVSDVVDFRFRGTPARVLDLIWDVYRQIAPSRTEPGH